VSRGDAVKRERSKAVMMSIVDSLVMGKRKGKEKGEIFPLI
tara:strand:+ start:721 stop:843 length:123 start_codon:yes stop_codon:yes gene_type:complete